MPYTPIIAVKLAATGILVVFSALVLTGNPQKPRNLHLATFLSLLAATELCDSFQLATEDQTWSEIWRDLAAIFAAFNPLYLLCFARTFPSRGQASNGAILLAALFLATALAVTAPWWSAPSPGAVPAALIALVAAFTAVTYTTALAILAARLRGRANASAPPMALLAAFFLLAIPAWTVMANQILEISLGQGPSSLQSPGLHATGIITVPAAVLVAWSIRAKWSRSLGVAGLVALTTVAGIFVPLLSHYAGQDLLAGLSSDGRWIYATFTSAQWILFAALMSYFVLRHDAFDMTLAAKRRTARVLVGSAFALIALAVLASVRLLGGDQPLSMGPWEAIALAAIVLTAQAPRRFVDRVASWIYAVPVPARRQAALEEFRAALEQRVREGESTNDPDLEAQRIELGIDSATARVMTRMAHLSDQQYIRVGHLIQGRYHVLRALGQGRDVFLARDELLTRNLVLKRVPNNRRADAGLQEARLVGSLNNQNIVTLYDAIERARDTILVEEYVPNGSLNELVDKQLLSSAQAARVLHGILRGLHAVHETGVVHLDIKPANILLASDGSAKIADFGIARFQKSATLEAASSRAVTGTLQYMAPEQLDGGPIGPRADLYAAGCIIKRWTARPLPDALE